jgi:AraC-like DNA-binding protein
MVFSTNRKAEEIPPFAVKSCYAGSVVYAPGSTFGPRIQQDLQLVLLHTGAMNVNIDGIPLHLPVEHIMLLKPGHQEMFAFAPEHETWHRWIAVTVEAITVQAYNVLNELPLSVPISDRMNRMVELMLLLQNASLECTSALKDLAHAALMLYISEATQLSLFERIHPAVLSVKEYIHQHFTEEVNLRRLAEFANVSSEHLIRLFQRSEGLTPTRYLWDYRVKQGLELIRSSGLSIGDIAETVGFKTSYHFARSIKQQTGKTATEIRKESWHVN